MDNITNNEKQELPCQEVVELVTDYLEQTLLADTQKLFEEHIADCPGCTNYLEQMRHTISLLHRLAKEPVLPTTKQDLLQRFEQWKQEPL